MAVTSGFFNSINGDRRYDARQISRYLGSLISSGVLPDPSTNLQVMEGDGMAVQVSPGKAFLDCYWMENDSMYTVILDDADMVLDRIDAVIMRLDENDDARSIDITVKKGTPSSTPQAPGMERGDKVKEYCLAAVTVRKMKEDGTQAITQADITDTRADTDVCGWVTGLIDQVDTHTLFLQWQDAYRQFYADSSAEFDVWMAEMESQLGDSVVVTLMAAIDGLKNAKADKITVEDLQERLKDKADEATVKVMQESLEKKAGRSSVHQIIIPASGWEGAAAPYTNTIPVSDVGVDSIVEVGLSKDADIDQAKAFMGGQLADGGQSEGNIILRAYGQRPDIDVPIVVVVRRDV